MEPDWFNALVDFHLETEDVPDNAASDVPGVLSDSIHTEAIGDDMWQAGYGVLASSHVKARDRAVDIVKAKIWANFGIWPDVIEVNTYGEDRDDQSARTFKG